MPDNKLYALDFDGVICDSAIETGISGWHAARQLWPEMPAQMPGWVLSDFRRIRPVLETGYEAMLICRGLFKGLDATQFLDAFPRLIDKLIHSENCSETQLKTSFAEYRDNWISRDLPGWIEMNPLYDGVQQLLQTLPTEQCFIITTKQERFVHAILSANGIQLPMTQVFGMDRKLKKTQILTDLQAEFPEKDLFFVEDRLPTLQTVIATPALKTLQLGFAAWGYNTEADKLSMQQQSAIKYLRSPESIFVS